MIWKRFCRSEDGTALVLVTIALPVLIGLALLVIDGGRVFGLHNSLQKGADALAIAAAAELDGSSDAIERASRAIANLVQNSATFADSLSGITEDDVTARYLSCLPESDDNSMSDPDYIADCLTASSHAARFVEITIDPAVALTAIFPASFLGGANSLTLSATAVAGFTQAVCDFMPVYICNPYEGTGISLEQAVSDPDYRRRMIEMRQQGGTGAQNFPGNYGFLKPVSGPSGANVIRDMLAKVSPQTCYSSEGVELRTGFLASVDVALNVRFDLYSGVMNSTRNDPMYRPARNVRKGYDPGTGNGCNQATTTEPGYRGLTPDGCFGSEAGCPYGGGRIGDGNWDFEAYWNTNHPTRLPPSDPDGVPYSNANPPSRYDIYRYEIDRDDGDIVADESFDFEADPPTPPARPETGVPQCYGGGTLGDRPDRRLLYGAILNCQALDADPDYGPITGGSAPPLPVEAFASFFITQPVESGPDRIIRVELVDIAGRRGGGTMDDFARDIVQLYR
jgi:Flp pilus assembly protein TadG